MSDTDESQEELEMDVADLLGAHQGVSHQAVGSEEEYPQDKYSPSCLVYGKTKARRELHVQVSLSPKVVVITVYEPDSNEWIDCRIRR